jgi:hypothetical protein
MAFDAQLDDWLQSFTQNSAAGNSSKPHYMESSALASGNESLTKLERLLLEEDTLFQQLQEKRAEIRGEKAQMQNGKNIEPMQGRAAVMS